MRMRYFLNADGSPRGEEEPGHCETWWQLRTQSLRTKDENWRREITIRWQRHEEHCETCAEILRRDESYAREAKWTG